MPGMPEKRAFFHRKTTDAAAGAGKIHRLAVQRGTCHRTEISVFHAALPAGTGMEIHWHSPFPGYFSWKESSPRCCLNLHWGRLLTMP